MKKQGIRLLKFATITAMVGVGAIIWACIGLATLDLVLEEVQSSGGMVMQCGACLFFFVFAPLMLAWLYIHDK